MLFRLWVFWRSCLCCEENIIIEPAFRDTAAAIGFGSLVINNRFKDSTLIVLASDHLIKDEENFRAILLKAVDIASKGILLLPWALNLIGLKLVMVIWRRILARWVKRVGLSVFCEKPNADLAKQYVDSGRFLWNSGMFVFNINTIFFCF